MAVFNIIGHGFLDMTDHTGVAFKAQNNWYRFAEVSLVRSTEFSVPATDHNRQMLGFGEDPAEQGEMLRQVFPAQMVYDGGRLDGMLSVTGFSSDTFTCVFNVGNPEWIEKLQSIKLSECPCTLSPVVWDTSTPVTDADQADWNDGVVIIQYENGHASDPSWQLVPSVNVVKFISNVLSNLGFGFGTDIPTSLWMVAGSMKGGDRDAVTFTQVSTSMFTRTQVQNYFDVVDITIEWATANLFGAFVGGGSNPCKAFKANDDLKMTFASMSDNVYLIKWDSKLARCLTLGGKPTDQLAAVKIPALDNNTISLNKGDIFFFASKYVMRYDTGGWFGFKTTDILATTIAVKVERSKDLALGENWRIQYNMPDMTIFEFIKSVCLATGREFYFDDMGWLDMTRAFMLTRNVHALDGVLSVDSVTRRVDCWGTGTGEAVIAFDSEDYVTEKIRSSFQIPNAQLSEKKEFVSKFSEGNVGVKGVLIDDCDNTSTPYKFKAKKWTLARAVSGLPALQRIDTPEPFGYDDIADNSTCLKVKLAKDEDWFHGLWPTFFFSWRGSIFVWTDASWSDGVVTMTLQRISQPPQDANP